MSELLYSLVTEMRGDYPDVPLAPGVQLDSDDSEKPFFVTLPLLKIGGQSDNGFTWERDDVLRVQEEIVNKRVEGGVGHVPKDQRSTKYDLPKLRWVGATLDSETLWGKAYVPKYAGDVREFFLDAFRTGAKVGTSVYGTRGKRGLSDMVLESIDLGHPDRLGFKGAGAVPVITSEMQDEDTPMSENNDALVAELRTDRDEAKALVAELQDSLKERDQTIAELEQSKTTLETLVSEFGLGDNPVADAKVMVAELAALRQRKLVADIGDVVAELVEAEAVRPYIKGYLVEETDDGVKPLVASLDEAKARVEGLLKQEHIQNLAKTLVREMRGPNAFVGKPGDGKREVDLSPEAIAKARQFAGI